MKSSFKPFLEKIAIGAGEILFHYYGKKHKIEHKPGAGIVTEADKFSEQFLLKNILRKYPKSTIITEETGKVAGEKELLWIMDPLDGTSNYAHHFPWFCVSIGLYENGKPKAGVIYQPITKDLYFAEKGKGTYKNRKRVYVSKTRNMKDALLGTGFYYAQEETLKREMGIFERMHRHTSTVRRPGSAALDLACVSAGVFDGFWERGLNSWDVAAGFLLVEEAGGRVTDYQGGKALLDGAEVVASNKILHPRLLGVLKEP